MFSEFFDRCELYRFCFSKVSLKFSNYPDFVFGKVRLSVFETTVHANDDFNQKNLIIQKVGQPTSMLYAIDLSGVLKENFLQ